jgi:hypothetical protein
MGIAKLLAVALALCLRAPDAAGMGFVSAARL